MASCARKWKLVNSGDDFLEVILPDSKHEGHKRNLSRIESREKVRRTSHCAIKSVAWASGKIDWRSGCAKNYKIPLKWLGFPEDDRDFRVLTTKSGLHAGKAD